VRPVEITAHRGSSAHAPENTLAAFRRAVEDGSDWIELDVQMCADSRLVVLHDRDLKRVAGDPRRVEQLTLEELKRIDVGCRFSDRFTGERVPTLEEAIEDVGHRARLNIELKFNRPDPRLAPAVARLLRRMEFPDRCIVTSMDLDAVRQVKATEPTIRVGWIVKSASPAALRADTELLSLAARRASAEFIRRAHQTGKTVHVWTVNEPEAMRRMIDRGADNIITDNPGVLRRVVDACKPS